MFVDHPSAPYYDSSRRDGHAMMYLTQSLNAVMSKQRLSAFCTAVIIFGFVNGTTSSHQRFGSAQATSISMIAEERMNTQIPAPFYDVLRKALKKRSG